MSIFSHKTGISTICIIVLAAGCQEEKATVSRVTDEREFIGVIENSQTRTALEKSGDKYCVNWVQNDKILIDYGSGQSVYIASAGGGKSTSFKRYTGLVPEGTVTAYYPYDILVGYPEKQEYNPSGMSLNPMMAVSDGNNLSFKNLGSIMEFDVTVPGQETRIIDISLSSRQSMSGSFTVKDGAAVVTGAKTVTLKCGGAAVGSNAVPFHIAVPSGTYTNLIVKVTLAGNKSQSFVINDGASVTLERSKLYQKALVVDNPVKTSNIALFPTGMEFNGAIKSIVYPGSTYQNINGNIKKIEFIADSDNINGVEIQASNSKSPIYAYFDETDNTIKVTTPATTLRLNPDASYMFSSFSVLEEIAGLDLLTTTYCTTMRSMFNGLTAVKALDLSNFKTTACTDCSYMFNDMTSITSIDCSSFNTSKVTKMEYMFYNCQNVESIDISSFNTSNCTAINHMFAYCYKVKKLDCSKFNTSNCTLIKDCFWHCENLEEVNVKGWNTEKVTDMRSLFNRCYALKSVDLSTISGKHITDSDYCGYFFYYSNGISEIIAGDKFMFGNDGGSNFFCTSTTPYASRPGSVSGGITIICNQTIANWFATTTLRWLNNGYHAKAIPVSFKDYVTGEPLTVTWPAN